MGLNTTAGETGTVAWVRCDGCKTETIRTQSQDKNRAKKRAERLAEEEGFVWYSSVRQWFCPACRIRRLADKLKAEFPKLCERYGIPVSTPEPTTTPKPRPARRIRKRLRAATPTPGTSIAPDQPPADSGGPAE